MQEVIIPFTLFACVVFYQLRTAETNTLLAIIIMAMIGSAAAFTYYRRPVAAVPTSSNIDTADRREIVSPAFSVAKFQQVGKYIQHNEALQGIFADLRFIKMFDKARLGDLLIHMDHFQKVYMYILAGRYRPESYIGTFTDLRSLILEILYSLIHVVPETLKHTYGFQPHDVIQKNIEAFTALSRRMLTIIKSYSKANGFTVPDSANGYYHPYEPSRTNILP